MSENINSSRKLYQKLNAEYIYEFVVNNPTLYTHGELKFQIYHQLFNINDISMPAYDNKLHMKADNLPKFEWTTQTGIVEGGNTKMYHKDHKPIAKPAGSNKRPNPNGSDTSAIPQLDESDDEHAFMDQTGSMDPKDVANYIFEAMKPTFPRFDIVTPIALETRKEKVNWLVEKHHKRALAPLILQHKPSLNGKNQDQVKSFNATQDA